MEITNTKASFPHPSKSLLAYFEIPKDYLEKIPINREMSKLMPWFKIKAARNSLNYSRELCLPQGDPLGDNS